MNKNRSLYIVVTLAAVLVIFVPARILLGTSQVGQPPMTATAASPSPTPAAVGLPGILDRPVVSDPPTQMEEGNLIFWGVCMACHGNEGQGLTDEWRETAFGEDKDCWASKCHASNHPPQGFEFPRVVPALVGGGRLGRFASAQQLYDYVVAMMPWWDPGSLTPEKAWQVSAYLLEMNGTLPKGITLGSTVASAVPVHRQLSVPADDSRLALFFTVILALTMGIIVAREAQQGNLISTGTETASIGRVHRPNFASHLHPPGIPAEQARWRYTLGAGGLSLFLCLVLLATGLLEMFYYIPTPEKAALSVETIQFFVPFGALIRNLHYWSAQLLVLVAAAHLLRVVFTSAYAAPRRFNFVLGLVIFVLVLFLDFTGYVLRWDEGIRWALVAGTNLLSSIPLIGTNVFSFIVGGAQTGPATLVRFYTWHIFALALVAAIAVVWHIFRVRRDGGISAPKPGPSEPPATFQSARITRADLLRREILAMFIGGILLLLLSILAPAPLAAPLQGTPTLDTDTRAPWFFLWVQQLLKWGDPFLLGVLLPLIVLIGVGLIPYLLRRPADADIGRWFSSSTRLAQIIVAVLSILILVLTLLALLPASNG